MEIRLILLSAFFIFGAEIKCDRIKNFTGFSELKSSTNWHRSINNLTNNNEQTIKNHAERISRTGTKYRTSSWNDDRSFFGFDRFFSEGKGKYCKKPATCQLLNYTTCFGTKLPYTKTTLDLIDGLSSQDQAQEQLSEWRRLINVPKCWAAIQPFLCSIYMPKCEDDMVFLPSQEMCKLILGPCRILATYEPWPSVFKCDNVTRYPPLCKNDIRELKFNTTGRCLDPLVPTDLSGFYFDGVEGCGMKCENPMFTENERRQMHKLVFWAAFVCFFFNFFTVATFMIDWKSSKRYPSLIIFYINFCFLIICIGWLAQFLPSGREDIVCRKDGTLRLSEPSAGENLSCVVVFVLVYYFLMAGIVWFVILTYACYITFQALGKIKNCMKKKGAYFHLVAWSLPLILTIATMEIGEIDGNSIAGICFVGYQNQEYRSIFVLLPILIAMTVATFFISKGLITLVKLIVSTDGLIDKRASDKIRRNILRVGIFSFLILIFASTSLICHIYEYRNIDTWQNSLRIYVLCKLGVTESGEGDCLNNDKPSLAMLQLHILVLFCTGITMSSWVWNKSTIRTWQRFLGNKFCKKDISRESRLKKHEVIAQAFAKRKMLNNDGRLSISMYGAHNDPVGLNFDLNSAGSASLSSTWAAALPKLVTRRGAIVAGTNSNSSYRRNSMDSDISYSVRRVSVESRRHSVDSSVSVKVSEVTQTLVKKVSTPLHRTRHHRPKHRGNRSRSSARNTITGSNRRGRKSNHGTGSSQESAKGIKQLMAALADMPTTGGRNVPNLNRRTASVGLDSSSLNHIGILAEKLLAQSGNSLRTSIVDAKEDDIEKIPIDEPEESDIDMEDGDVEEDEIRPCVPDLIANQNQNQSDADSETESSPSENTKMIYFTKN